MRDSEPFLKPTRAYYYAGSQRVAVRGSSAGLSTLYADHLGSASVAVSSAGTVSRQRYKPWGERRDAVGAFPTDRLYTGQIYDGDTTSGGTGLYFYNARYYDPVLGRFTQADTVVPDPATPLAFDRYAYTLNNPVRYTDPSGHYTCSSHEWDTWDSDYCYGVWIDPSFGDDVWLIIQTLHDFADLLGGEDAFMENVAVGYIVAGGTWAGQYLNGTVYINRKVRNTVNQIGSGYFNDLDEYFKFAVAHELAHGLAEGNTEALSGFGRGFWKLKRQIEWGPFKFGPWVWVSRVRNPSVDRNEQRARQEGYGVGFVQEETFADAIAAYLYAKPSFTRGHYDEWIEKVLQVYLQ